MANDYQHPKTIKEHLEFQYERKKTVTVFEKRIVQQDNQPLFIQRKSRKELIALAAILLISGIFFLPPNKNEEEKTISENRVVISFYKADVAWRKKKKEMKQVGTYSPSDIKEEEYGEKGIESVTKEESSKKDNGNSSWGGKETMNREEDSSIKEEEPSLVVEEKLPEHYLEGVHDIDVAIDSSMDDLIFYLTSGVSCSGNLSINYEAVNLSVAGNYPVFYTSSDGLSQTIIVTVY